MSSGTTAAIDPADFRETLGHYPTGVAVVTGRDPAGEPVGMVVGTFSSVSLDPPLVSFSPQQSSSTFALLRECATFCVNVLAAEQEDLCRQMATGGVRKFDGVDWTSSASGAPIIDGVVAWVECAWEQVIEAGDHYIVLGRVLDLAVPRAVPPLLFFQGGYGKFSAPSLMAASSPDLLEAVRLAETIRADIEACSASLGVTCSVSAKIAHEIVTVLVAQPASSSDDQAVGQRVPHIAPLGASSLHDASADEIERWMSHLRGSDTTVLEQLRANLAAVRANGYSVSVRSQASDARRRAMAEYSAPDSLPSHARTIRDLIAASVHDYEPVVEPGGRYDLYAVTVPLLGLPGGPPLTIRITGLHEADGGAVLGWINAVRSCAERAAAKLRAAC